MNLAILFDHLETPRTGVAPVEVSALDDDETSAMVYVGDVYALVAREGAHAPTWTAPVHDSGHVAPQDDSDLWPFIR